MSHTREYPFYYVNGFLYMGLMVALMVGWFLLVGVVEALCHRYLSPWPLFVTPSVIFAGLIAIWWVLRFRLSFLYTRQGVGAIGQDGFELRLPRRNIRILFDDVWHLTYQDGRRGKGLILSAKSRSVYLEPPYGSVQGDESAQEALKVFYLELKTAYEKSRQSKAGGGEIFAETQEQ